MDEQYEWLKVPEVAEMLRIARSRAYALVADREISAVKIGRSVRVKDRPQRAGEPQGTGPLAGQAGATRTPPGGRSTAAPLSLWASGSGVYTTNCSTIISSTSSHVTRPVGSRTSSPSALA